MRRVQHSDVGRSQSRRYAGFLQPLQQSVIQLPVRIGIAFEDVVFDEIAAQSIDAAALAISNRAQQVFALPRDREVLGDPREDPLLFGGHGRLHLSDFLGDAPHRRVAGSERDQQPRILPAQLRQLFLELGIGVARKAARQAPAAASGAFGQHRQRLFHHPVRLSPR